MNAVGVVGSPKVVGLGELCGVVGGLGFQCVDVRGAAEVCFAKRIEFEGLPTVLRVYSGVFKDGPRRGECRPLGKDDIRLVLGRWDGGVDNGWDRDPRSRGFGCRLPLGGVRVFKSLVPVRRVWGWEVDFRARVAGVVALDRLCRGAQVVDGVRLVVEPGRRPLCPVCGSAMTAPKLGRKGWFHGCSRFSVGAGGCRGLVDAVGWALKVKREEEAAVRAVEASVRERDVLNVDEVGLVVVSEGDVLGGV